MIITIVRRKLLMKKWNKMKSNIADEELKYKFMNGYNLFYQEDSDKITIIGMKKNLLFYLTSSCSSQGYSYGKDHKD